MFFSYLISVAKDRVNHKSILNMQINANGTLVKVVTLCRGYDTGINLYDKGKAPWGRW